MTDCVLPVTGGNPLLVALLGMLVTGVGVAVVFSVRRHGMGRGTAAVIAFALAAASLVVGDAHRADAQDCAPSTTVPPTVAPTTIAATTSAAATTTTTIATTTTAATTTTTIVTGGAIPTTPTTVATTTTSSTTTSSSSTSSTTTTVAVPDLEPIIVGGNIQGSMSSPGPEYRIVITNVGTVPTTGPMTFDVLLPVVSVPPGGALVDASFDDTGGDWFVTEVLGTLGAPGSPGTPTRLTITSKPGVVIDPNLTSSVFVNLSFQGAGTSFFAIFVDLPVGIGGETNATNNATSHLVTVLAAP